jgi:adenine phosphoribosyltransferase
MDNLEKWIQVFPDFPSKGILFRDISPLLADPVALRIVKERLCKSIKPFQPDYIAGIDARGFLFSTLVAEHLEIGSLMVRKSGKLPGKIVEKSYNLEYGSNTLSMQIKPLNQKKVVIIDDLLATGGSMQCSKDLIRISAS